MAFLFKRREPDWSSYLRPYVPSVPPPSVKSHIPVLREQNFKTVQQLLANSSRTMLGMGVVERSPSYDPVLWWQALGTNRSKWTSPLRQVFDNRQKALRIVATELENQVPGFQGLAKNFRYDPAFHALDADTGGVVVDWGERPGTAFRNPRAIIGDPAFRSPSTLIQVAMHEGRHVWQSQFGGEYNHPNVSAEADAHLFDLEHRHLSGIGVSRIAYAARTFREHLDVNDRLATGKSVDSYYTRAKSQGGWGISEPMSSMKRADLELRWSFVRPEIQRELNGLVNKSYWNRPFGHYQSPLSPPVGGTLRSIWDRSTGR